MQMLKKPKKLNKWKKNLYENFGYDDNYTDPSFFLKDLQTNKDVKYITLSEAILGVTKLTQQLSSIVLFLIVFHQMYMEYYTPQIILFYSLISIVFGYLFYKCYTHFGINPPLKVTTTNSAMCYNEELNTKQRRPSTGETIKSSIRLIFNDSKIVCSVLFFGYILSPLLHSLTNSISTDTIFSITFFAIVLHLIFFDYGVSSAFMVSKAISLNSAIFGAICLASRLSTAFHAFTLLVVSAQFFALLPIVLYRRRQMMNSTSIIYCIYVLPGTMIGLCLFMLYTYSISLFITYCVIIIFINVLCPIIFILMQKYKNNIHGPWDEAVVVAVVQNNF